MDHTWLHRCHLPVTTASLLEQGASSADTWTLSGATTKTSYSNWLFAGAHVDPGGLCVEYVPDQLDNECVPLSQCSRSSLMFDSAEPESRVGKGTSPFTSRARDTLRRPAGPDETRLVPIGFLRDTSTSSHAEGRTYSHAEGRTYELHPC